MRRAIPFLATLTLLGGCFSLPPGPGPDLSTPYNTLRYLEDSYAIQDSSFVYQVLDDDFRFAFDREDWDTQPGDYRIPPDGIWTISSERTATRNMFYEATGIDIYLALKDMEPLIEGASIYTSGPIYYRIIYYYNEDYDSYYITGYANFDMQKQDGDWIITRWSDQKVGEHSWGWLKALYRL
ncbi:MAG TPA: hypothetical protein VM054_11860 [bacterium]|nr:hypothetical protein [bacterium]